MAEMMLEQFGQIVRSPDRYPVDFDQAWQWVGYARKDYALDLLKANFEEGLDYFGLNRNRSDGKEEDLDSGRNRNQAGGWGGDRRSVYYFLTVDCFKSFCMMAKTDKGKEVRKYYLQIEKKYFESHGAVTRTGQTADLAAVNALIKESVPRIKLLVSENERLRQMNRLYEEVKNLREQLARKNTPISENEKRHILACAGHWSVADIARFTGRSETAIRRVIKGKGETV